ncbi:hypothetical protein [Actimicrobium sp. CCI2.3]|uniref:hypothetical protein n=1 Tax=Actimicrobium sp. CCI2.3 TaxID=3048616 RepID=UPI002B2432D1|nr:hypothetical protein [Actimicrobium sp. CCI2.3]MEB0023816.1 hypothetical protein [Actimicrobium sp. CCI2.3]
MTGLFKKGYSPMLKIMFSVDENTLRQARLIAEKHHVSVASLLRNYLATLAESGLIEGDSMTGNCQALFDYSLGKLSRHKTRRILGVDDFTLTTMLRVAGFPPPRATNAEEEKMLDDIKDVHFAKADDDKDC